MLSLAARLISNQILQNRRLYQKASWNPTINPTQITVNPSNLAAKIGYYHANYKSKLIARRFASDYSVQMYSTALV